MGGLFKSGGSKSASGSGQKWAQGYAKAGATDAANLYNSQQGATQQISGQIQSLIPGLKDMFEQGNPTLNAAQGYAQNVLGGKYLDQGNPHLQGMLDSTSGDVTNRVNGAVGTRGGAGGSSHAQLLTSELAKAQNALRYADYGTERGYQQGAMQAAPQMAQADYLGITPLLATAEAGVNLPYAGLNNYTSALSALFNGGTSKTSGPGLGTMMLGNMASGAGAAMGMG